MGDSLHGYMGRRASSSAPRRLCGYLYNPAGQKQMRTRVTRPSTIFAKRSHALGAPVQSSEFKVQSCETKPMLDPPNNLSAVSAQSAVKRNYETNPLGGKVTGKR